MRLFSSCLVLNRPAGIRSCKRPQAPLLFCWGTALTGLILASSPAFADSGDRLICNLKVNANRQEVWAGQRAQVLGKRVTDN